MGKKISAFTELTTALGENVVAIVNGAKTYKITFDNLFKGVVKKIETGLLSMKSGISAPISLGTTFTKIPFAGVVATDMSNGHITYTNDSIGFVSNGSYTIVAFGSIEAPNNVDIIFSYFLDGVELNPDAHPEFLGRGVDTGIPVSDSITADFTAGQVLEIRAKASTAGDIVILYSNTSVEKKVFS